MLELCGTTHYTNKKQNMLYFIYMVYLQADTKDNLLMKMSLNLCMQIFMKHVSLNTDLTKAMLI